MEKIAALTCLDACRVCTGAGCLRAWNERTDGFAEYKGRDAVLCAFMHCNGCGSDPKTDEGIAEKVERLAEIGVKKVRLGVCTVKDRSTLTLCPSIIAICDMLKEKGIDAAVGTHRLV